MFKLSYSLNSADLLPIEEVCGSLLTFGYSGVELSFQRGQFDPFLISETRVEELRDYFARALIKPVCISTATTKFLSSVPHEPSLINTEKENRVRRAMLIGQGLRLAEIIGIPLVSFQSGYLRDEHTGSSRSDVLRTLTAEIKALLSQIRGAVNLVIEPEPGMFIETIADARKLIFQVDDARFGLHMDIGHVFCTEKNYLETIRTSARDVKYVHIADIREGFNLKYQAATIADMEKLLDHEADRNAAVFYDIDDTGLYLFVQGARRIFVAHEGALKTAVQQYSDVETLVIDKAHLNENEPMDIKHEILADLDSVSGINYERALRAYNAVACLRRGNSHQSPVIMETVCNTIKGKVHYHDLFGNGKIDYAKTISALMTSGYAGYCTVELYNHASLWRDIAPRSAKFILSHVVGHFGWDASSFGHIDHRKVVAPYIRVADAQMGPESGVAVLYDLRLCQPNTVVLPVEVLHTLEHCLLWILPGLVPGFLGVGPMGCQTGLYLTTAYPLECAFMKKAIITAFNQIKELDEVPYRTEVLCGMAKNHDLPGAKSVASAMIALNYFNFAETP
jgi:S-ribosylhomocysteine lyase LuxS involved in autoinducer biosynthesis/sugar phosphate isomerase/epimerase